MTIVSICFYFSVPVVAINTVWNYVQVYEMKCDAFSPAILPDLLFWELQWCNVTTGSCQVKNLVFKFVHTKYWTKSGVSKQMHKISSAILVKVYKFVLFAHDQGCTNLYTWGWVYKVQLVTYHKYWWHFPEQHQRVYISGKWFPSSW